MKERFDELLPWYANGTLNDEERAWVDRYLAEHPESRAELDWYRSLSHKLRETAPAVPETIGLAKAMTLIRGDRPTLAERVSAFFAGFGMRPAVALAGLAIVAVQGGIIFNLMQSSRDDAAELRSLRATVTDEGPVLKVNFSPQAREADIRLLLVSINGRLTGGPGQLGDWYVAVPKGQEAAAADKLKGQPIVLAVELAPGVPPRE